MLDWLEVRDWLQATDPGRLRLRTALRAVLTMGLVLLLLSTLAEKLHQPITLAFLGAAVAMVGSIGITDPSQSAQRRTLLWLPLPALLCMILGILLGPWPLASALAFLVLAFVAVAMRRFGNRGMALGLSGMMSYFFALFFPLALNSVPWLIGGVFLAVALLYMLRFWLLPDRPRKLLQLSRQALRARLGIILNRLAAGLAGQNTWAFVQRQLLRLNDQILEIDALFGHEAETLPATEASRWLLELFERELSIHRLVETSWILCRVPAAESLLPACRRVLKGLRTHERTQVYDKIAGLEKQAADLALQGGDVSARALRSFCLAASRLNAEVGPPLETELEIPPAVTEAPTEGLHPATRLAWQAALATGLAMALGAWVSPARWSWAAFSAFIVFVGATRGSHLLRAWQRLLGTLAGLGIGLGLAEMFVHQQGLELGLIFAAIFLGVYLLRVSYAWAMAGFSIQIALLYSLMGKLNPGLLEMRLIQTLIGVAVAAIVAICVMPRSSRQLFYQALGSCLAVLAASLEALAALEQPQQPLIALESTRDFERASRELHTAAVPLLGARWPGRQAAWWGLLHDVLGLSYYLRQLAMFLSRPEEGPSLASIRADCLRLASRARSLAEALERRNQTQPLRRLETGSGLPWPRTAEPVCHWLDRLEQLLGRLEWRLNLDLPSAAPETLG